MSLSNHFPDCWRQEDHPACRLAYIHELEVKVLALETQLQYERTGHLTEVNIPSQWCAGLPRQEGVLTTTPLPKEPVYVDHIEPPIVSGGPTWASHQDDPPSLTP